MELNNGEVIAAILAAGVFNRLYVSGHGSMNDEQAAPAVVKCYGAILDEFKREQHFLFEPDHSKAQGQGA